LQATAPKWLAELLVARKPLGKEQGWAQAGVWAKRGMILLPEPGSHAPWLHDFEEELYRLPNSRYKDQGDALALLVDRAKHAFAERWRAIGAA
jgi:hypothetical protein